MRENIIEKVLEKKVIAIVRGVYGQDCLNLAKALNAGGIAMLEVTFDQSDRTLWQKTAETITLLTKELGDKMIFGAGTVTTTELVKIAKNAGAQFIVSPDTNEHVIKETVQMGMVSMPGAMTPTEILTAHRWGADFVKVFPTANLGAAYIKAVRGPLNHIRMLAVGGVNEKNAADYMQAGCVGVGVGGQLVNKQLIANGEFEKITHLAQELTANVNI